jgi:hypothetical protein
MAELPRNEDRYQGGGRDREWSASAPRLHQREAPRSASHHSFLTPRPFRPLDVLSDLGPRFRFQHIVVQFRRRTQGRRVHRRPPVSRLRLVKNSTASIDPLR